ncbi:MAG: hypothetical protein QMB94_11030, partial [Phycisphaerales bacterium]
CEQLWSGPFESVRWIRLRDAARAGLANPEGPGFIELVPDATHNTVVPFAIRRFYSELRRMADEAPAS